MQLQLLIILSNLLKNFAFTWKDIQIDWHFKLWQLWVMIYTETVINRDEKEIFFWLLLDDYIYWSAGTSLTIFADVFLCHPFWRNAGTKNFESHCGIFLHSSTEVLKGNYIIFVKIKFLFRHLDQVPDPLVSLFLEPGAEETVFLHQKR